LLFTEDHMPAPSKAEQDAEALARVNAGVDSAENAHAAEGSEVGGDAPADPAAPPRPAAPAPADDAPRAPPPVRDPFADKRAAITARFRESRGDLPEDGAVDGAQMADFVRSGMPPEFAENNAAIAEAPPAAEPEPAPTPEPQPEPAAPPQPAAPPLIKLKVNGREVERPLNEVIAQAQIALASEDILGDAKKLKGELDTLVTDARNRVARADPSGHHAGEPTGHHASPAPQPGSPDTRETPPNQDDAIAKLIETIQFGDANEARTLLNNTIQEAVTRQVQPAVQNAIVGQRFQDEGARTAKVLKDFEDKHSDLAKDPMARAAMEQRIYDLQLEDLKAINVDPATIPTPGGRPVTPADIAMAHRWYRVEKGFALRGPEKMLETARDDFLKWKGGGDATTEPKPADPTLPPAPPRIVQVTVDRTARQTAVPPQPSRTVAPRRDNPAPAPAQRTDGSSIVANMNARRLLPRGKAGIGG
jgi:hypothetical protein